MKKFVCLGLLLVLFCAPIVHAQDTIKVLPKYAIIGADAFDTAVTFKSLILTDSTAMLERMVRDKKVVILTHEMQVRVLKTEQVNGIKLILVVPLKAPQVRVWTAFQYLLIDPRNYY